MTPEQVSALSDVELNRAMIWCYPPKGEFWADPKVGTCYLWNEFELEQLHYLDDYNLTMPLAVENELRIDLYKHEESEACTLDESFKSESHNPLRAICEVLVLIKCQS